MTARRRGLVAAPTPAGTPRLRALFGAQLPAAPACEYLEDVELPMWANDRVGDCTCATFGALVASWTHALTGTATILDEADILAAYSAITGWHADDPATDTGAVETDVIAYMTAAGIKGHRIDGHAHVAVDHRLLAAAIWIFGGVSLDLALPANADDQTDAGRWTVVGPPIGDLAPGAGGNHEAAAVGRTADGLYIVRTWGARVVVEPPWLERYCVGAWALRSPDFLDASDGLVANGIDVATWNADLAKLGG